MGKAKEQNATSGKHREGGSWRTGERHRPPCLPRTTAECPAAHSQLAYLAVTVVREGHATEKDKHTKKQNVTSRQHQRGDLETQQKDKEGQTYLPAQQRPPLNRG